MQVVLRGSDLESGGLRLLLSNDEGQSQDATSVVWAVYAADGSRASGLVQAVRRGVGEYVAQWRPSSPQGTYRIVWTVVRDFGSAPQEFVQSFAVLDEANYPPRGTSNLAKGVTQAVGVYLAGSVLGRGDLPLFLRDSSGLLQDAYAVYWTVTDGAGRQVVPRTSASHAAPGEYFAAWSVTPTAGEYTVRWEWSESAEAPLRAKDLQACVVHPFALPIAVRSPAAAQAAAAVHSGPLAASCPAASSAYQPQPAPMPPAVAPVEVRALLSESGGPSPSVTVQHPFGSAPVVYVLKKVSNTWVDAVGTVDVVHDAGFTSVTVTNATDIALDVLIRISGA